MKQSFQILLLNLALCLAALVGAAPPAINGPQSGVDDHQPAVKGIESGLDTVDLATGGEIFNITVALNGTSPETVKALGYDPSRDYHGWATVEVWTGGSSSAPVNFGDTRGSALSDKVFKLLDAACPADTSSSGRKCCKDSDWKIFGTNALIKGDPSWKVVLRKARVKTQAACWESKGIRIVMARIVADTLRAYTRVSRHRNCYEVPGVAGGYYCNVPQFVRVNLPSTNDASGPPSNPTTSNFWHVETWGIDALHQFSEFGELRPCQTRHIVDLVMDKYANDLVGLFPQEKGWFHRETRVMLDGYRVCSNEP
ncbi:hypothetical protein N0V95_007657 [Ascochyta clinopodiicola]|nr:hypothetical protein N0V95_007657 [Ascochyta clinopodiicola]